MKKKQELIDIENEAHTTEEKQREELEAKLALLQDEYDAIMEGQRAERERREAHEKEVATYARPVERPRPPAVWHWGRCDYPTLHHTALCFARVARFVLTLHTQHVICSCCRMKR
jgi:hypothetical protein